MSAVTGALIAPCQPPEPPRISAMLSRTGFQFAPFAALAAAVAFSQSGFAQEAAGSPAAAEARADVPLERIAFGSCIRENLPQPMWETIGAWEPQLMLLIGDNIYGDSDDMAVLREKWQRLADNPGFAALRKACPLLATWDDHDFGRNDAGADYAMRKESQQVFLDWLGEPADSPRRKQEGVYAAQTFGPEGKRVQVILLDTRYHRSALARRPGGRPPGIGPYIPAQDAGATMLGEAQWRWLEERLREPAEVRIIASSVQAVPVEHCWEGWGNFPAERQRLFHLIAKTGAGGAIFISGDRHKAEISRLPAGQESAPYPLYDITSSSINQPSGGDLAEPNRYRVNSPQMFGQVNHGRFTIDWSAADPTIKAEICGLDGKPAIGRVIQLSELRAAQ
ncbi:MAG: alkaline phosphatase D family protein [Verrucomicrobiales bacterium]